MSGPNAVRQVALAGGADIDATLRFWNDVLALNTHARFDPPGIAFIMVGGVRFLFEKSNAPATVYLDLPDVFTFCKGLVAKGVALSAPPRLVHHDKDGQFGPAGEGEWMAFVKDPAGNAIGLVTRRPG
ncbi:MAG TPA: glyoxalase [Rhizobiaceae bacterium]|nr:glyoxalase [Rhizobiaceae bacterium]